jgi:hypothetical protein
VTFFPPWGSVLILDFIFREFPVIYFLCLLWASDCDSGVSCHRASCFSRTSLSKCWNFVCGVEYQTGLFVVCLKGPYSNGPYLWVYLVILFPSLFFSLFHKPCVTDTLVWLCLYGFRFVEIRTIYQSIPLFLCKQTSLGPLCLLPSE